jgi:hypothetical protein
LLLLWLLLLIALKKAAALVSRVLLKIQNMVYCGHNDGRCTRRRDVSEGPDCSSSTRRVWQRTARAARGLWRLAPLPAHAPHFSIHWLTDPAPSASILHYRNMTSVTSSTTVYRVSANFFAGI